MAEIRKDPEKWAGFAQAACLSSGHGEPLESTSRFPNEDFNDPERVKLIDAWIKWEKDSKTMALKLNAFQGRAGELRNKARSVLRYTLENLVELSDFNPKAEAALSQQTIGLILARAILRGDHRLFAHLAEEIEEAKRLAKKAKQPEVITNGKVAIQQALTGKTSPATIRQRACFQAIDAWIDKRGLLPTKQGLIPEIKRMVNAEKPGAAEKINSGDWKPFFNKRMKLGWLPE